MVEYTRFGAGKVAQKVEYCLASMKFWVQVPVPPKKEHTRFLHINDDLENYTRLKKREVEIDLSLKKV
jgi:hypothetical protein